MNLACALFIEVRQLGYHLASHIKDFSAAAMKATDAAIKVLEGQKPKATARKRKSRA